MGLPLNRQPIFTATPLLISLAAQPAILSQTYNIDPETVTEIYRDASLCGCMIRSIRLNATAANGTRVNDKRVYLLIYNENSASYNLYLSAFMTGINQMSTSDNIPFVEFNFQDGLIIPPSGRLAIMATTNASTSSEVGDNVTVIIQGGTYDQPQ